MFYNYSQRPQTYGIGSTIKLIQQDISVNATSNYDMDFYATEVDMLTTALNYKYCKILEVALVQDNINLPNEQEKLYGYIDWGELGDIEQGVLDKNDNAKIFKNIGKNCFKFKPPRITTEINVQTGSSSSSNRTVSFNGFNTCATLYGSATYGYRMPFSVALSNKTASARIVKVIVKILFRGSIARSTSSLASKMEEIANREKSITEIIKEKEQELYNLKLKEKMLVEEGVQTDEVLINSQPNLDLSIQEDNNIYIKSEKQKKQEEREERLKKQREEAEQRRKHKSEVKAKIVKDLAKAKVNVKVYHDRRNQESLLDYLLKNYKPKYKTVEEFEKHADEQGCVTVFPRELRDPKVDEQVYFVLDEIVHDIFKPVKHRITGEADYNMDEYE